MDQLPRLGKRELICLLLFTCNYVVFVRRGFLFLWVLGMGYVILLWHSLSLPYNYFMQYTAILQLHQIDNFQTKKCDVFKVCINYEYSFETPHKCEGVSITCTCKHDVYNPYAVPPAKALMRIPYPKLHNISVFECFHCFQRNYFLFLLH